MQLPCNSNFLPVFFQSCREKKLTLHLVHLVSSSSSFATFFFAAKSDVLARMAGKIVVVVVGWSGVGWCGERDKFMAEE
jgi:hypothetical protein